MVNYNINRYTGVIAIIAILIFIICLWQLQCSLKDSISYSISITGIIAIIFIKFAWKWSAFKGWLVPFPNLSGKWKGIINSTYRNATTEIPVELYIKQTFMHVQIKCTTNESKSNSIVASFNIDQDRDILQLCYSYQNDPKATLQKKSPIHYGSVILNINEDNNHMEGQYWTSRNTTGEMSVKRIK